MQYVACFLIGMVGATVLNLADAGVRRLTRGLKRRRPIKITTIEDLARADLHPRGGTIVVIDEDGRHTFSYAPVE